MNCRRWKNKKCNDERGCGNTWCKGNTDNCPIFASVWKKRVKKKLSISRLNDLKNGLMSRQKCIAVSLAKIGYEWFGEGIYSGIEK